MSPAPSLESAFCLAADGQLHPCDARDSAYPETEYLPMAATQTHGNSHDQNVLVETQTATGYTQTNFHMGTVAVGISITFIILAIVLLCYCAGKRAFKQVTRIQHQVQASATPNNHVYDVPRKF